MTTIKHLYQYGFCWWVARYAVVEKLLLWDTTEFETFEGLFAADMRSVKSWFDLGVSQILYNSMGGETCCLSVQLRQLQSIDCKGFRTYPLNMHIYRKVRPIHRDYYEFSPRILEICDLCAGANYLRIFPDLRSLRNAATRDGPCQKFKSMKTRTVYKFRECASNYPTLHQQRIHSGFACARKHIVTNAKRCECQLLLGQK